MAYDSITSRTDAGALVPEEVSKELLHDYVPKQSAARAMFRPIPVGRNQVRVPVLSALPVAYFVGGDTGLKQTTEMAWSNKYLNIEEIATIFPIPENVMDDIDANIWDEAKPLLAEAAGRCLDNAVFFGVNAPSSYPTNIYSAAVAAGNVVDVGSAASAGGFYGDIDKLYGVVEDDGYEITGFVAATSAKKNLRAARDTQGRRLDTGRISGDLSLLDGLPVTYPMRGMFPVATNGAGGSAAPGVSMFGGDWTQFVIGIRQDITFKVLDQAVIQDNTGAIMFNLAQQDMVALRLTFRVGWQVANTINNDQPNSANRYAAGVLRVPGT